MVASAYEPRAHLMAASTREWPCRSTILHRHRVSLELARPHATQSYAHAAELPPARLPEIPLVLMRHIVSDEGAKLLEMSFATCEWRRQSIAIES